MHLCLTLKINTYNKCKPLKFAPHTKEIKSKLKLFEEVLWQTSSKSSMWIHVLFCFWLNGIIILGIIYYVELCQNLYTYYVFEKNITMSQNLTFLFDSMDSFYCLQCIYFPLRTKLFYSLSILKVNAFSLFCPFPYIFLFFHPVFRALMCYIMSVWKRERGEKSKKGSRQSCYSRTT